MDDYDLIWRNLGKKKKHKIVQGVLDVFDVLPVNIFNQPNQFSSLNDRENDPEKITLRTLH